MKIDRILVSINKGPLSKGSVSVIAVDNKAFIYSVKVDLIFETTVVVLRNKNFFVFQNRKFFAIFLKNKVGEVLIVEFLNLSSHNKSTYSFFCKFKKVIESP